MKVAMIVAVARNRVIGRDGRLPWHLSEDLQRFRSLTTGHWMLMGRRTFESIGRALPGRESIVLSRHPAPARVPDHVHYVTALQQAIDLACDGTLFVIGGAEVYTLAWPFMTDLYLTILDRDFEGDVLLPEFDLRSFQLLEQQEFPAQGERCGFTFFHYHRREQ